MFSPLFTVLAGAAILVSIIHVRGATVTIDNTDPSVEYFGQWTQSPSSEDPDHNSFDGTLALTAASGAFATFRFNATKIIVYGVLLGDDGPTMNASFTLDQGPPEFLQLPNDTTASGPQYRVKLWQSKGDLSSDGHTFQVTNQGQMLILDYFQFEVPDSRVILLSETSTPSSTSSTSSTTSLFIGMRSSPEPFFTTSTTTQPSSSSSSVMTTPQMTMSSPPPSSSDSLSTSSSLSRLVTVTLSPPATTVLESATPSTDTSRGEPTAVALKGQPAVLTSGGIAGVAVGASVAVHVAILAGLCIWRRRRRRRIDSAAQVAEPPGEGTSNLSTEQLLRLQQPQSPSTPSTGSSPHRTGSDPEVREAQDSADIILESWKSHQDRAMGGSSSTTRPSSLPTISSSILSGDIFPRWADSVRDRPGVRDAEVDGGIRLAGGPPGQDTGFAADHWVADPPPGLDPPPYRRDYSSGDGHTVLRPNVRRCST
ncbi:hypothetical protein OH77DRAFT_347291 [Trametes cingulata]|nr:hypothetical protein OH77DRAFT_347291 [Trametes cingulata]